MSLIEDNISLNDDTFPHRLASLIKGLDLSQADICKKTGISKQALHHYLSGTRIPRADTLLALSKLLNVSVEYLLTGENDQSKIDTKGLTDAQIQKVNEYASLFRISNSLEKELPISLTDAITLLDFTNIRHGNISDLPSKDYSDMLRLHQFYIIGSPGSGKSSLFPTTRTSTLEKINIIPCPNCKRLTFSSFTFCPKCGKKLVE